MNNDFSGLKSSRDFRETGIWGSFLVSPEDFPAPRIHFLKLRPAYSAKSGLLVCCKGNKD